MMVTSRHFLEYCIFPTLFQIMFYFFAGSKLTTFMLVRKTGKNDYFLRHICMYARVSVRPSVRLEPFGS